MRNRDWLGNFAKVQSSSITVLEEFPTYLACAGAHEGVVVKLEDELKKKKGSTIRIRQARRSTRQADTGSISVIVDDGSKMVATYTYFCGCYTLVPDRKDISGFFPWE